MRFTTYKKYTSNLSNLFITGWICSLCLYYFDGSVRMADLYMFVREMELQLVVVKSINLSKRIKYVGLVCEGKLIYLLFMKIVQNSSIRQFLLNVTIFEMNDHIAVRKELFFDTGIENNLLSIIVINVGCSAIDGVL